MNSDDYSHAIVKNSIFCLAPSLNNPTQAVIINSCRSCIRITL